MNIVFFDLETQKLADEVGGWDHIDKMGLSVGVTYSTKTEDYLVFLESQVQSLIDQLETADLVVGYNIKGFDYHVLKAYTNKDLWSLPTFDMLEKIKEQLDFRLKLDNLAKVTLGMPKFADGLSAVKWWKDNEVHRVIEYCKKDVEITKRLYEYGCDKGRLWFMDRNGSEKFVVTTAWASSKTSKGETV